MDQDYVRLGLLKTQFRGVPLMALTATATDRIEQVRALAAQADSRFVMQAHETVCLP
jgi:superfamily II DNA helicase RecQ